MLANRGRRYQKDSVQYLDEHELDALFSAIRAAGSLRDRAIFEVAYHRGLRASEVRLLNVADFNAAARVLFIRRLKKGNSGEYPITDREHAALLEYLCVRGREPGSLFLSRNGRAISRFRLHQLMNLYGEACGLSESKRHFHCLRHTAGTMLVERTDIDLVQDHLGHRDIRSTLVYAKVRNKRRTELGRRLAKDW